MFHDLRSRVAVSLGLLLLIGADRRVLAAGESARPAARRAAWREGQAAKYVITAQEDRTSEDRRLEKASSLFLTRTLHVRLRALPREGGGPGRIQCVLNRVELTGESDGRPIRYDPDRDRPGTGSTVADLLSNLGGAGFEVRLAPDGVFKEIGGLDAMWRGKGLLIPPASVLGMQFLFRDQAMLQLLAESLSPPLPPDPPAAGAAREDRLRVEIPFVTMLDWVAKCTVAGTEQIDGVSCVHVTAKGGFEVARPVGDAGAAGLRSTVLEGHRESDLHFAADTGHVVRNTITHDILLDVMLKPPAGGDSPTMKMRQRIKISAVRAGN